MWEYVLSMLVGFWMGISSLLYLIFYWIEEKWDLPSTVGSSASSSHAKLQNLVQRVIEEALKLPALLDYSGIQRDAEGRLPEFNPKTYEELLTTAILNKVIDRYQHDNKRSNGASSSGVHSGSSSPGEFGRERRRRSVKKNNSPSLSPEPSSLEPMSQDDYGHSDSSGHVTDTPVIIEECNIERTVYSTDDDDDYYTQSYDNPVDGALSNINFKSKDRVLFPEYGGDVVDMEKSCTNSQMDANKKSFYGTLIGNSEIYTNDKSWEENWLFQKKKIKPSQSVPVPMLIPNSNTEYRAMIGDRDAEDTTDLSDAASDIEDENTGDIKHVLVNSKTIIGGKNPEIVINFDETNNFPELDDNQETYVIKNKLYKDENENNEYHTSEDIEPKIERLTDTKNTMKSFLQSLESDDTDDTESFNQLKSSVALDDLAEATNFDVVDSKECSSHESLENQQQESEYTETVTVPVQRHLDSLKRQHNIPHLSKLILEHNDEDTELLPLPPTPIPKLNSIEHDVELIIPFTIEENYVEPLNTSQNEIHSEIVEMELKESKDNKSSVELEERSQETNNESIITKDTENITDDLIFSPIPGSIAEREHKKWMNAIPMENNPYSPEAIESRLNKQKQLSLFDSITKTPVNPTIVKEVSRNSQTLQQILSEEIKENVRYGRDYYINQAKSSTGARIKSKHVSDFNGNSFSRSASVTSNEVSLNDSLNSLEAVTLHSNISRICMKSKNASQIFAINPLYENIDEFDLKVSPDTKVLQINSLKLDIVNSNKSNDSIRLNIPDEPEMFQVEYESLSKLRSSKQSSLTNFNRSFKKRKSLNNIFGGSLRIHRQD